MYSSGLKHPTAMAFGPDGRLYVTQDVGTLVVASPGARRPTVVARGLRVPLGLVWDGSTLFVSEQGKLERFTLRGGRLTGRRVLVSGLPFGRHQQDNVVVGTDGRLYLGSGSTCNACRQRDPRSAAILSLRRDGSDLRVFARGLRNPFGLAIQPSTGRLYASVNGRDDLGDSQPAETVVQVRRGADYGFPSCWADARRHRLAGDCNGVASPAAYLEPHSSADGIAFWGRDLFVAEWGEYLSHRHGRKVVRIRLGAGGNAAAVSTFATDFDHPLALATDAGGLLVADWGRGILYRISRR